ncbi:MAG: DotU family type IV/VI secretion system protein [Terriglobales bacterium]
MGATVLGAGHPQTEPSGRRRSENLAHLFEEILTVTVRIRGNRQPVADAQKFRADLKAALKRAEKEALTRGYMPNDIHPATFAMVAFIDESVLNSSNAAFSDWSGMPLQEEMYGKQLAGEIFFENLDRLLARPDNQDLADLLEVYVLCLLLGYKGRYGLTGQEALRPIIDAAASTVRRIRGPLAGLSPAWRVPEGAVAVSGPDPWMRRLLWAAGVCLVLAVVLFAGFHGILAGGAAQLSALARFKRG